MLDWEIVVADLETLHHAASDIDGWNTKQTETYIKVGEWGLALNGISYAYLNSGKAMPTDLFEVFERLAVEMDMEEDPEFEGVAQLRAETKARLA